MPCNTIRSTPITFSNVAFTPGHQQLMVEAIESMGFDVQDSQIIKHRSRQIVDQEGLVIFPKDALRIRENRILYANGVFQVPDKLQDQFTLPRIQTAYGMAAARLQAKRNGWTFTQTSETEFEFARR